MNFTSDNVSGIVPEILQALIAANDGAVPAFGDDACTRRALTRIADAFETPTESFFVTSGTAANALALSVLVSPFGAVYCHEQAHIETMECGAPGFYTGGAALYPLPGVNGKLDGATLREALRRGREPVTMAPPARSASPRAPRPGPSTRWTSCASCVHSPMRMACASTWMGLGSPTPWRAWVAAPRTPVGGPAWTC
jgi:threonine aldolase